MKWVGVVLSTVCAVIFVIATPLSVIAYNVDGHLLSSANYKKALDASGLYQRIPAIIAATLRAAPDNEFESVSDAELEEFVAVLLPMDATRPVLEEIVDQFVAYGRGARTAVSVSMAEFKSGMVERAPDAYMAMVANKPLCSTQPTHPFQCRPTADRVEEFRSLMREGMTIGVANAPVAISFPEATAQPSPSDQQLVRQVVAFLPSAPFIPLILFIIMPLPSARTFRGALYWRGVATAFAAVLTAAAWALSNFVASQALSELQQAGPPADALVAPVLQLVSRNFSNAIVAAAGGLGLVGCAMLAGAVLTRPAPGIQGQSANSATP